MSHAVEIRQCKFPHIEVHLSGRSQDPFFRMTRVRRAMESSGIPVETLNEFTKGFVRTPMDEIVIYLMNWVTLK